MKIIENRHRHVCNKTPDQEFCEVYRGCKDKIERRAFYLTGSKQQMEDIAQEVFLKLWLKWPVLNNLPEQELEAYIYTMVKNHILNMQRKESRTKNIIRRYAAVQTDGYWPDEIVLAEGFKMYSEAINKLPPKEKEVYLLYNKDLDRSAIAGKMRRSKSTINNQLYAASRSVKSFLIKRLDLIIRYDGRKKVLRAA